MKFIQVYIIGLVVCVSTIAKSQTDFSLQDFSMGNDSSNAKLGIWLENDYNSNVLNNSVYYNSVFKTGISRYSMLNMKGYALEKNQAGLQHSERLYYSWKSKKSSDSTIISHNVNLGTRRMVDAKFGKDAFLLLGMGNKQFAGSSADLSNVSARMMQFSQLQYVFSKNSTNKVSYGVGLSFLMGHRYLEFETSNSYLYTSEIGDSVYLDAKGHILESDTSNNLAYNPSGYGAALDAYVAFPVNWIKKHDGAGSLKIELNEVGAIFWNDKGKKQIIDGTIDWDGVTTESVFDLGDSTVDEQVPTDLREDLISGTETGAFNTFLMPRLAIYYTEHLTDKIELINRIDYRFNSNYLPYVSATQRFLISKPKQSFQWKVNVYESLGGYGYFGFGLGLQAEHKKFGAVIGSRHILAATVPENLNGFNLHFGFHLKFP